MQHLRSPLSGGGPPIKYPCSYRKQKLPTTPVQECHAQPPQAPSPANHIASISLFAANTDEKVVDANMKVNLGNAWTKMAQKDHELRETVKAAVYAKVCFTSVLPTVLYINKCSIQA